MIPDYVLLTIIQLGYNFTKLLAVEPAPCSLRSASSTSRSPSTPPSHRPGTLKTNATNTHIKQLSLFSPLEAQQIINMRQNVPFQHVSGHHADLLSL